MRQFDAVNAFINSDIDKDIYIQFPEGFGAPRQCLKLLQALYGLRQLPLLWFKDFLSKLEALSLKQVLEC